VVGIESGQFEQRITLIGEKITQISVELSNAAKQLEERTSSFEQTYTIVKGNVDRLAAEQDSKKPRSLPSQEESFSSSSSSDPLTKLSDHLSLR
jgi:phage-related protein